MRRFGKHFCLALFLLSIAFLVNWFRFNSTRFEVEPPVVHMSRFLSQLRCGSAEDFVHRAEFRDVLVFLRMETGELPPNFDPMPKHTYQVDWYALERAEITPTTRLSFAPKSIAKCGSLLTAFFQKQGLFCAADDELIEVSSNEETMRRRRQGYHAPLLGTRVDHQVESALESNAPALELDAAALFGSEPQLDRFLETFQSEAGISIKVDWNSLKQVGVGPGTIVHGEFYNLSVGRTLSAALQDVSRESPLNFEVANGQIVISTEERLRAEHRNTRIAAWASAGFIGAAILFLPLLGRRRKPRGTLGSRYLRTFESLAILAFFAAAIWATQTNPLKVIFFSHQILARSSGGEIDLWIAPTDLLAPYRERDPSQPANIVSERSFLPEKWRLQITHQGRPANLWTLNIPCSLLVSLFAILPSLWLLPSVSRATRQAVRRRHGRCTTCGYDLRGSAGRCPECGTTPRPA